MSRLSFGTQHLKELPNQYSGNSSVQVFVVVCGVQRLQLGHSAEYYVFKSCPIEYERRTKRRPQPIAQADAGGAPDGDGDGPDIVEAGMLGIVPTEVRIPARLFIEVAAQSVSDGIAGAAYTEDRRPLKLRGTSDPTAFVDCRGLE